MNDQICPCHCMPTCLIMFRNYWQIIFFTVFSFYSLKDCWVDVLWDQPIKLIQVASNSELRENQWNDLLFFEIDPTRRLLLSCAVYAGCVNVLYNSRLQILSITTTYNLHTWYYSGCISTWLKRWLCTIFMLFSIKILFITKKKKCQVFSK